MSEVMQQSRSTDWMVWGLLGVAAVLLFANLQNGYLWQDEAETALLARNTLRFGYPKAFDGRSVIDEPMGYGPGQAWIYSPWLPFYLLAGVFAIFGESTWIARLPFALFGWLSIFLTWRLSRLFTDDRRIHRLTVALLTCSVPFLLHMRQCRYYAMTTALLLGVCLAYLRYGQRPSVRRAAAIGLLLVSLFHTNFGTFIPTFAALILHHIVRGKPGTRRPLLAVCGLVAALTVPWALFFYRSGFVGTLSLGRVAKHVEYYVRVTNKYLVPLGCMAGLSMLAWLWNRRVSSPRGPHVPSALRAFLILMVAAHAAFLLIPDQRHLRYLMPIVPLLLMGEAWWLVGWQARHRLVGWLLTGLALFTNVLQSPHVNIPLVAFVGELTHTYRGPMDGVVNYLQAHARPNERAKIPYDDRTLMFYTELAVERPSAFFEETYPEWVILRRPWMPREFYESDYFRTIQASYDRIELDVPDLLWQNREDPGSHQFRTVEGGPRVVIYRKREARHG